MPSIFTLDGARLGALRDSYMQVPHGAAMNPRLVSSIPPRVPVQRPVPHPHGISGMGFPSVSNIIASRIRAAQGAASNFRGFGGAISTGLGELSTGTRNTLIALGTIGLIAVVAHGGFRRAARRRRRGR